MPKAPAINGQSYWDFLKPLFETHLQRERDVDLNIEAYPLVFSKALDISSLDMTLAPQPQAIAKQFPAPIQTKIEESGCTDILSFLEVAQAHPATLYRIPVPGSRRAERDFSEDADARAPRAANAYRR